MSSRIQVKLAEASTRVLADAAMIGTLAVLEVSGQGLYVASTLDGNSLTRAVLGEMLMDKIVTRLQETDNANK